MAFSVFEHAEFSSLLESLKTRYPGRQTPLTFEQLAKKIGYTSPRLLPMVIHKQRLPSEQLVDKISAALDLSPEERSYLELLRLKEKLATGKASEDQILPALKRQIEALADGFSQPNEVDLEKFKQISEWYYPVILQLLGSARSQGTLEWVAYKLGEKVPPAMVQEALSRLVSLGMLEQTNERYRMVDSARSQSTPNDIPSSVIKRHHAQSLQCAIDALYRSPVERREFQSLVLRVTPEQTDEAKQYIRDFVFGFRRKFGGEQSSRVCRLNLQFFEHTSEDES